MNYERDFDPYLRGQGIQFFTGLELAPVGRAAGSAKLQAPPCELWPNIVPTLRVLEWLRADVGKPIVVNSGYRDLAYNRAVGSTDGSMHTRFRAVDFRVVWHTPADLVRRLERHPDAARLGIGLYASFVHVDTRGARARW